MSSTQRRKEGLTAAPRWSVRRFQCRSLTQRVSRMILTLPGLPERAREELVRLRIKVFYHDKCFDGACSASLFTRFHRECIAKDAAYDYHGLVHRAGALFDESE